MTLIRSNATIFLISLSFCPFAHRAYFLWKHDRRLLDLQRALGFGGRFEDFVLLDY